MLRPALNDPDVFPDHSVLSRQLGPAKAVWDAFMAMLKAEKPPLSADWRYYNDGKSWLCKVTHKAKTICWLAVWDKFFTAAFYLNTKAEPLVRDSSLDSALKDSFFRSSGKFRSIRIELRKRSELEALRELIGIKLRLK